MKDLIELKSRGEEHNYLRRLVKPDGSESHTYMLKDFHIYYEEWSYR